MRWKALKHTKDIIISHLRMYFNNIQNYENLLPPQLDVNHFKNMMIYDADPEELRGFPIIIISSSSGDMITSGLSDFAHEIHDPITNDLLAYRYGGMYEFNLTIEIGTKSTLDREVLSDLITNALRFAIRRKIEASGVLIKSMRYNGESTVQYDSNLIFVSNINLSTWSEWYEDITLLPIDDITINKE